MICWACCVIWLRRRVGLDRVCVGVGGRFVGEMGLYPVKLASLPVLFSPTAECFGVFSHSKGFGADRSSSKTHSPEVPRFQVKVPK